MMTYIFMIDYALPTYPMMLAHVISAMERNKD
jgi:hypothetical protein